MTIGVSNRSLRMLVLAAGFSVLYPASPAWADPIVVTSGNLNVPWDDPSSFEVVGANGFDVAGLFISVRSPQDLCFRGCPLGTRVNMSALAGSDSDIIHNDFLLGLATRATVNGVNYLPPSGQRNEVSLSGTLRFDAPDVLLPPFTGQMFETIHLAAPFEFQGQVAGFLLDSLVPLFQVTLNGRGTAILNMGHTNPANYTEPSVVYTFDAPAATPEPTTFVLFGTSLTGWLLRRRLGGARPSPGVSR
jgi:PEP-CTERM motif